MVDARARLGGVLLAAAMWTGAAQAQPLTARYLFELEGVPVGTVDLEWNRENGEYVYRSTQLFTRDEDRQRRVRTARFEVDEAGRDRRTGRAPEALLLWRGPSAVPGGARCAEILEELSARSGSLCFGPDGVGTVFGQRFTAHYAADGLSRLELGAARFRRVPRGVFPAPPPDVFARGFPIEGDAGELALEPALAAPVRTTGRWQPVASAAEAQSLAEEVTASFDSQRESPADFAPDPEASSASCLGHALRYRERARQRGFDALVVHGLVVREGEEVARPHAWVRVLTTGGETVELDPTLDVPVRRSTHLPLALVSEGAPSPGELWLKLLSGVHRVVRR